MTTPEHVQPIETDASVAAVAEHHAGVPAAEMSPAEPDVRDATVRRAPKWSAFILVGTLVGLLVTIAVTTAFPADPNIGMPMTVFVVGIFGVSGGAAVGAILALIADRRSSRRARQVTVERGEVITERSVAPAEQVAEPAAEAAEQPAASTEQAEPTVQPEQSAAQPQAQES